ncbi:MAG TPA: HypC/HybG/HupF family hydrogenase formation chaperone [Lentisphaeria bacterium]|nr:MAG: hypothetical protein A2X45_03050 [Lentisphaerae bacterium GWF2_50_93]HCE46057.1 HypC/HybG/HupF family hydrogenase formation chaperone [Lentisphaeria bacterium]
MCLAVPMKIISISTDRATGSADFDGVKRDVNLTLIENPCVGDYVIIHAGFAIEKFNVEEAEKQLEIFHELAEAMEGQK